MTSNRQLRQVIPAVATSDGAGVKIKRSLGQSAGARLDPILMLDEFNSEEASDYIAGFPSHPHRGFETVTYMLDGHMLHEDHMGNRGDLRSGDVQWMTAGRGIIHSEMPQQLEGRMRGFQLWINLPAAEKLKPAAYRDIAAQDIPGVALSSGGYIKVIAGSVERAGIKTMSAINGVSTEPLYWDISLPAGKQERFHVPLGHQLFVYPYQGSIWVGDEPRRLENSQAGVLSDGELLDIKAESEARLLVIGGKPIGEPIAQYGPFVMNTADEIEQAINDYRSGQLTA
ncbi:pirin family protein [Gilvimarinus sp. SDUM040013]|uniref:Pirin family protein n=1 Tax=Gilvimarinus gilvus TaxID=3058038 RepID=A0ABU4RXJ9_9GAMM|nr:pirin family protein [Gilvimarinus sp. SDUM040013]MDO3385754.1 pirin family protein [Gilvimarinus sp. SDUM040013]MDX6849394.1 pirin family protein [Gilvimarinus sp. SDUM040013]